MAIHWAPLNTTSNQSPLWKGKWQMALGRTGLYSSRACCCCPKNLNCHRALFVCKTQFPSAPPKWGTVKTLKRQRNRWTLCLVEGLEVFNCISHIDECNKSSHLNVGKRERQTLTCLLLGNEQNSCPAVSNFEINKVKHLPVLLWSEAVRRQNAYTKTSREKIGCKKA